jgi:tripartite-type tricarboxylate transporter receptor subunit TctC
MQHFLVAGDALAAAATIAPAPVAAQESWPARRGTLVVPFGAGSNTDALARWMAEHFKDILGQPVIVENRGGAGGTLGANAVTKAAPDGYTFRYGGNTTDPAPPP